MSEKPSAFTLSVNEIFSDFNTGELGLTEQEAALRKTKFGSNTLPMAPAIPWWQRFLTQFNNVLIYVLIASATVSALMQHYVDCGIIIGVILINAIVGFIQEGKAESALRAILSMTRTQSLVVRDGELESIASEDLVPGDVVMLQAGDKVPADVRLFFCKDLRCDESALTGEAQSVSKHTEPVPAATPLAERRNMAYMGTLVTYGLARGVVISTGLQTEIGAISDLVSRVQLTKTPLQIQLTRFAHQLTIAILLISTLTIVLGIWLHDYSAEAMFQAAIGIAVAAIPEGLPAIVTIALAIGVQRMASNHALVRRLPAVEVLGSVDVICSDKTGTLTTNAMTAREVNTASTHFRITGEGYKPEGHIEVRATGQRLSLEQDGCFTQACRIALLCNDANLTFENNQWILHGDPTEGALLVLALKHGLTAAQAAADWPRRDILPFESERRYMATLHHDANGQVRLLVKGAPERLLDHASHELHDEGLRAINRTTWEQAAAQLASQGMRVLALAYRDFDTAPAILIHSQAEQDLIMTALVGIADPPRAEAIASIHHCHQAGIRVKMITGDNPVTAAAIGAELGLDTSKVLTGAEIDTMTEAQLEQASEDTDIFARTSPANKLQLVTALQKRHHVVAMTGDGVNDAPALKKASIGVAMGYKGTDAAKEAAAFVLTDDNFSTIAKAVAEGRTVYDNILKSIIFILPTSLAEALMIFAAILSGSLMPITPVQILWINMITAVTLSLALVFERAEPDIMARPPRPFGGGLFTRALFSRMLLVGCLGALIVFLLFHYYRSHGASLEMARTVAVNALVMIEVCYLFNCRFLSQTIFSRRFLVGSMPTLIAVSSVIAIQILFTYYSGTQALFDLEPIHLKDWVIVALCALPILFIVELEKFIQRRSKQKSF